MYFTTLLFVFGIVLSVKGFSDDFFDDWFDGDSSENIGFDYNPFIDFEYNSLKYATGFCYFHVDKIYQPAEFEAVIQTDHPTNDFYSNNFMTFERKNIGMEYDIINMDILKPGLHCIKYTLSYFGWRKPNSWCFAKPNQSPTTTDFNTHVETTTEMSPTTTTDMLETTTKLNPETTTTDLLETSTDSITQPETTFSPETTSTQSEATTTSILASSATSTTDLITPTTPPTTTNGPVTITTSSTTAVSSEAPTTTDTIITTRSTLPTRQPPPTPAR